jgi:hypothetical protein
MFLDLVSFSFNIVLFTTKGSGSNLLALTGVLVGFVVSDILVTTTEVVHDGK